MSNKKIYLALFLLCMSASLSLAGKHFFLRSRPNVRTHTDCLTRGVPKHAYARAQERFVASVVGVASADQPVPIAAYSSQPNGAQAQAGGQPAANGNASQNGPAANGDAQNAPAAKLRKTFFVDRLAITAGRVSLRRISLMAYDDGRFLATGALGHDGGEFSEMVAGKAIINVRLYIGTPGRRRSLSHASLIAQHAKEFTITGDSEKAVSFLADGSEPDSRTFAPGSTQITLADLQKLVKQHFNELNQVEVVLEYLADN